MKKILLFILTIFSLNAFGQVGYIPADLDRFEKTHICLKCDLSGALLYGGSYSNSVVTDTIFVEANMSRAQFSVSDFTRAIFTLADMDRTMFSGSNFSNANLSNVDLSYSNLSSCDFTGANLAKSDLSHAILMRAKITDEQLKSAKTFGCAIMPDGSIAPPDQGQSC